MNHFFRRLYLGAFTTMIFVGGVVAAEPDPKILGYTLPADIKWVDNATRTNQTAQIYGDPAKPGPYAMLIKWRPGNMSRPHFHEHD
jgi:hypothetical protein